MRLTPTEPKVPENIGFTEENDIFEYQEFGTRLADLVSNIAEPLVIVLDAPWGSGKSVFIKQWAELIRGRDGSVVYFDAFGNDIHDDAFLALASEIHLLAEKTLGDGNQSSQTFLDTAKKVGKTLAPIGLRLAARVGTAGVLNLEDFRAGGEAFKSAAKFIGDEAEEVLEKTISKKLQKAEKEHESFEKFREALENVSKAITEKKQENNEENNEEKQKNDHQSLPLIFIVDELDRCRPPFALDVIERVKHLFSVQNVCFVLVMDLPQFETAVQGAYGGKFDARTYLEKFYHLKVMLPELNKLHYVNQQKQDRYLDYLWRNLNPEFKDARRDELVLEEFRFLVKAHELSLRQIERALTNVVVAAASAREAQWFVPPVIAGLCIMRQKYRELYKHARENNLTWNDVKDFLKIDSGRSDTSLSGEKWVITWWRYFVDPDVPPEDVDNHLGMFMREDTFETRRSLQRTLTNYIDNLPNPPAPTD